MENIIYNELRSQGYNVDVGLVELGGKDENGKFVRKQLEVDFVVNRPPYRVYIQSAFHMLTPEKEQQERCPLLSINDHFRKIVIVGDDIHRKGGRTRCVDCRTLGFLDRQELVGARINLIKNYFTGKMLGGTVLYISRKVVHTQYISASEEGKQSHALDALFQDLIKIRYKDLDYFDFGTSYEEGGKVLNASIIYQKEGFGGRGVVYNTYEWEL